MKTPPSIFFCDMRMANFQSCGMSEFDYCSIRENCFISANALVKQLRDARRILQVTAKLHVRRSRKGDGGGHDRAREEHHASDRNQVDAQNHSPVGIRME